MTNKESASTRGLIGYPSKNGLYDPRSEKDSCGVGFVANIKGKPSHGIMEDAYHINSRMDHRGGCGFEENTGDGAGILTALPDSFFQKIAKSLDLKLPEAGQYAVGNIFLPQLDDERKTCKETIESIISEEGLQFLTWRTVPINPDSANIGPAARTAMPVIEQLFIANSGDDQDTFERMLYTTRKRFTNALRGNSDLSQSILLYACSLSSRVIVYKGMLTPTQLFPFYSDLENAAVSYTHLTLPTTPYV